jgi:hypothetical protein
MRQLKIAVPLGGGEHEETLVVIAVVGLALLGTAPGQPFHKSNRPPCRSVASSPTTT